MPRKGYKPKLKTPKLGEADDNPLTEKAIQEKTRHWKGAQRWAPYVTGLNGLGHPDVVCWLGYSKPPEGSPPNSPEVVTSIRCTAREHRISDGDRGKTNYITITRADLIRTQLVLLQQFTIRTKHLISHKKKRAKELSAQIAKETNYDLKEGFISTAGYRAADLELWPEMREMMFLWISLAGTGAFMPFTEVWQNGLEKANPIGVIDSFFAQLESLMNETRWRNETLTQEIEERVAAALKTNKNLDHGPKERRYNAERGKGDKQHGVKLRSSTEMGLAKVEDEAPENDF